MKNETIKLKKQMAQNRLLADSSPVIEAIEFGNWLGYHYYRVAGWKWRQIRDEKDKTEYPIVVLYDKFKRGRR